MPARAVPVAALETARARDPSPTVRKKAGWFTPGGTIYQRTVPRVARLSRVRVIEN
jgi:hypothetical protein